MVKGNNFSPNLINVDTKQAGKLYQVLSEHLRKSARGKQLITAFEADPLDGSVALANYLRQHLPEDNVLAEQLAEALGTDAHFTNIVTGQVEQIINIARLGVLNLTVKKYLFIFRDVNQVVAFLAVLCVIGVGIAYGIWLSLQPRRMAGDFNIAVAEFMQPDVKESVAPIVSQRISSFLDGQYKLSSFEVVKVAHNKIGIITSAEEARTLAEKINAHLVIYGDVAIVDDQVLVTPQFYVIESHQSDVGEVNGEHRLAARINLHKEDLVNPSEEALKRMEQSTKILTEFTKALVYLAAGTPGDLILARESIDNAIAEGESYGHFAGKEVLYLFASDIARRQKDLDDAQVYLERIVPLNDNYGRGYLAQANIYYDQQNLFAAIETYQMAKQLKDQPFGAYITEKASLGIGNSCVVQFQNVMRNVNVDQTGVIELANCVLSNCQVVIDSYLQQKRPEANLQEMAAWAYYNSGIVYQESRENALAQQALKQVLHLTDAPSLANKAQARLNELRK